MFRKAMIGLSSVIITLGPVAGIGKTEVVDAQASNHQVSSEQHEQVGAEPTLPKTENIHKTEAQIKKYNKQLDALQKAYENGGEQAVESLHKALGHKKLDPVEAVKPAAFDSESEADLSITVWRDSSYNYFWEVAWDLGSGAFTDGSENVRDVVGIAISQAESPYDSLDGWAIADDSLQRITVQDEDGDTHDANANWEQPDKYGVAWSFEDEESGWDSIGEKGYAIAQLTKRQDSYEDFMIHGEYTHNWSSVNSRLTSIGWGAGAGSLNMSVSWEYYTESGEWDDNEHNTYSRYYSM